MKMKMNKYFHVIVLICGLSLVAVTFVACRNAEDITRCEHLQKVPEIKPDYTDIIIPPNIAPMNFVIKEPGSKYLVKIHSDNGDNIKVSSSDGVIKIPLKKWKSLLAANHGNKLQYDIFTKTSDGWKQYQPFTNIVASEEVDSHLAYRSLKPVYSKWRSIGINQRNLTNFDESVILHGKSLGDSCVNCHTFQNNNPSAMILGFRGAYGSGTVIYHDGKAEEIGTKWGYTSWHPSGKLAVYSINKVRQFFHTARMEVRDVVDLDAAMCYYMVDSKEVKTTPALADPDRLESYPCWSPDGKYLYYCSASIPWKDRNAIPPENYDKVKYDLRRVSYDLETDNWGQPETILSSEETGLSILIPRITPDGRFLVFCMCDYGCFPIYQPSSDLYLMDLDTHHYNRLDNVNSQFAESWHSFSTNSRWMAFSSKKCGGLFTRTHFSYIDQDGKVYKPFILPQKDPAFYDSLLNAYSVPELLTGPVKISQKTLTKAIRSKEKIETTLPLTGATVKAGASEPWQQGRQ